jgi:hypothetical protein
MRRRLTHIGAAINAIHCLTRKQEILIVLRRYTEASDAGSSRYQSGLLVIIGLSPSRILTLAKRTACQKRSRQNTHIVRPSGVSRTSPRAAKKPMPIVGPAGLDIQLTASCNQPPGPRRPISMEMV